MIDGVLMVFPCGYNVHRLRNYIFWEGMLPVPGTEMTALWIHPDPGSDIPSIISLF